LDELRKANLLPTTPQAIRIERFIEKRFKVTPTYEDLPLGVLGFTRFTSAGVESIVISRTLAEEDHQVAARRVNTTMAHEAGHGLLHAHLFAVDSQPERLFGSDFDPETPRILCRDETGTKQYDGKWWEFQANKTIGALLLPKPLVEGALAPDLLVPTGMLGVPRLNADNRKRAVERIASIFEVNPVVARIRLEQLFPESQSAQLGL
jgi:hypothetical protein